MLALAAWAAAGCGGVIKKPEVRLAGVRLGGIGLQGGLLYFQVAVDNPNSFRLEADGLSYDLDLAGDGENGDDAWLDLAEGKLEESFRVDAGESAIIEVPVRFRYNDLGGALRSLLDNGTFNYRVRGAVQLEAPMRTEVPFRKQGSISLSGTR